MSPLYFFVLSLPVMVLIYVNMIEAKRRSRLTPQERIAEDEKDTIEMRIW